MLEMYTRGVKLVTGRVNARAAIPPALDLVSGGLLEPGTVTDSVVSWDDAAEALVDRPWKVVIQRPPRNESRAP